MQQVFIHGSGGTSSVWKYQTEYFRTSSAINLPGRPTGELCQSIQAASQWLKSAINPRQGNLVLVGHSLGGGIALQYALDHPEDLAGIVLIGSGARLRVHPDTLGFLEQAVQKPAIFADMFTESWQKVDAGFAADLLATALSLGPSVFLGDFKICDQFDVMKQLGDIDTPTLAIVGTEDVMTPPKYSQFLIDRMPNASMEMIEGGTHFVFAEFPNQVNAAIERFLSTL